MAGSLLFASLAVSGNLPALEAIHKQANAPGAQAVPEGQDKNKSPDHQPGQADK